MKFDQFMSNYCQWPFMRVYSNIWTFVSAPTLFELFLFHFCNYDGEGHLSYSRQRETQRYVPFLLWYCIKSWACVVFIFLIFLTQYMFHCLCTVNFIQTLSHTKSQITKLICCIYATLTHSGYKNTIILNFFKSVVKSFFLNTKYI